MPTPPREGLNRSGSFMEINAGKLAISLDLKKPEGKRILEDLIRNADVVLEGYSPGTMDRMGLGYDRLRELNPGIIYLQQSGFGQHGVYGRARAFGPTAQAFSGISDMSGLPEPRPPAGIGYSYLDWFGAYNMATAALAALYQAGHDGPRLSRRRLAGGGRHLPDRNRSSRSLGQWPPLVAIRQPFALSARRAAWGLPDTRRGQLDRDRRLHRRTVASGRHRARPSRVARRSAVRRTVEPARE